MCDHPKGQIVPTWSEVRAAGASGFHHTAIGPFAPYRPVLSTARWLKVQTTIFTNLVNQRFIEKPTMSLPNSQELMTVTIRGGSKIL